MFHDFSHFSRTGPRFWVATSAGSFHELIKKIDQKKGPEALVCRSSFEPIHCMEWTAVWPNQDQSGPSALTPHIQQFATMLLKVGPRGSPWGSPWGEASG